MHRVTLKIYKRILLPTFLVSVCAYLDRINLSYAALSMNRDLGLSAGAFGLGAGIFFIGYFLFSIPGALIAEKYGVTKWLAASMVAWGLVAGLMAFVKTPWQFYAVRFLLGSLESSAYPIFYGTVIPRWFSDEHRPLALSVLLTSLQVSAIVGAPLAGWLLGVPLFHLKGWQVLFLLEALPPMLLAAALPQWMADRPNDATWLSTADKEFLATQMRPPAATENRANYTVWQALRDRVVLKLSFTYSLWIVGYWAFGYWLPTVLQGVTGWTNLETGFAIDLPMALSLIAMVWNGHHSSKTGERRWHMAVPLFIGSAAMLLLTTTRDPIWAFGYLCIAGIAIYAPIGIWWSLPTSLLSGAAAAGAAGLINSFGNMGGFLGPYLTGVLKDMTGSYTWAWIALSAAMACAGFLVLTLKQNFQHVTASRVK